MNYMSRKKPSHIFWVDKNAIKIKKGKVSLFPTRLKYSNLNKKENKDVDKETHSTNKKNSKKAISKSEDKGPFLRFRSKQRKLLPSSIDHDCKIMYDRGAYYLVLTVDEEEKLYSPAPNEVISLDPGVRTFQTGYSPDGLVMKAGEEHIQQLKKLYNKIDHLRSIRSQSSYRKKWRLRQRLSKLELKFYNISQNFHNQLASLLVNQFNTILLPEFRTSEMLTGNKIGSKTKREMQGLSHYRFQQKLKGLCERDKRNLVIVTEEYTTKTCGCCGHIWNAVGGSKIYRCQNKECKYEVDRDVHGSRNILIKYYTEKRVNDA
jgi:putative transposase